MHHRSPRLSAVALAALATGALVTLLPAAAAASCADDTGPAGSPVVFVGTAQEERRGFTRFAVEEVWAGPDLAGEVWVQSGQEQPPWPLSLLGEVSSSTDAEFRKGETYVVGASESFVTNACIARPLAEPLAAGPAEPAHPADPGDPADPAAEPAVDVAPPEPRLPTAGGSEGADPPLGVLGTGLWTGGVLLAMVSAIAVVRAHRADL